MNPEKINSTETQPPSLSCPQLTVDKIDNNETTTSGNGDISSKTGNTDDLFNPIHDCESALKEPKAGSPLNEDYNDSHKDGNETSLMSIPSKSLLTKTYSFKRILSFRSDNFRRGNARSISSNGPNNLGKYSPSRYYSKDPYNNLSTAQTYKPLTFSFLGQIYAKKSIKGERLVSCKLYVLIIDANLENIRVCDTFIIPLYFY